MKLNRVVYVGIALALVQSAAFAQATSSATQSSASTSVAQGSIQFSQTPADSHISETVRNVSAPVLGAYASSFSQMNCSSTAQGGVAVAGFSLVGGASKDSHSCVLEVSAAEMVRQSTVDPINADRLREAAVQTRCQINAEIYHAMVDAGFTCKRKPGDLPREETQPANYRVATN